MTASSFTVTSRPQPASQSGQVRTTVRVPGVGRSRWSWRHRGTGSLPSARCASSCPSPPTSTRCRPTSPPTARTARGRPWVTVGMVASLDGATAVDGTSGALGGPADKAVFRAVRAIADVILVAAGTVRAERYRPVTLSDDVQAARVAVGRDAGPPRLAIVTASLDLDLEAPLFTDGHRPLVLTTADADPDRVARVSDCAEVRHFGTGRVDLGAALGSLADDGVGVVVAEGGPTLNGALVAAGLVDEWCLTISPTVAGGDSSRIVAGAPAHATSTRLVSLLMEDDLLFGPVGRCGLDVRRGDCWSRLISRSKSLMVSKLL